jgi:predicted Zn-dependent peptidase
MSATMGHVQARPFLLLAGLLIVSGQGLPLGGVRTCLAGQGGDGRESTGGFGRPKIFDSVEEYRLDNGMLFLLLPRHEIPAISGRILFRVGTVDSPAGQSGIAHVFEHMAFKGTDRIGTREAAAEQVVQDSVARVGSLLAHEIGLRERGDTSEVGRLRGELERLTEKQMGLTVPGEYYKVYDRYSFNWNAWTSIDFTAYEADVPGNDLEVWMLMESERLKHPSLREFYRELDVIREERRQALEDNPQGMAWEQLCALSFLSHPYRLPVIGYMSDLETLTQEDAERFRAAYYVPGNGVAALVGDFDPVVAKTMIQSYFGDFKPGPLPSEVTTLEAEQKGMRRGVWRQGTERGLYIGFHTFAPSDRRSVMAGLLARILTQDNTSRLQHRLVVEEKMVRRVSADPSAGYARYPGLFVIEAQPLEQFTNEEIEVKIWEELDRLVREPVTEAKLREIKSSMRKESYRSLRTNESLANDLTRNQAIHGDWRHCYQYLDLVQAVTAEELTSLSRDLFRKDKTTVIFLEPEESTREHEGGAE